MLIVFVLNPNAIGKTWNNRYLTFFTWWLGRKIVCKHHDKMIISDHGAIWDRVSFEMPRHRKLELDAHRCLLTYRWMHQSDGIRIKCLLTGARLRWLVGRGRDFSLRLSAVTPGYWFLMRRSNDNIDKWSYCRLMTIPNFSCAASHGEVAARTDMDTE